MSTIKQLETQFLKTLDRLYPQEEALSIFFWIAEEVLGRNHLSIRMQNDQRVSAEQAAAFARYLQQLSEGKPVQYVLGYAWFLGSRFMVTPDVLIPRPETEELVTWIVRLNPFPAPRILDIGTGSGCIPIALQQRIAPAKVFAWDVSAEALQVARGNAQAHRAPIHFEQVDVLQDPLPQNQRFDIIVSNPPYIALSEKQAMRKNVVDFEPPIALFVPHEDPLLFYRTIAKFAQTALSSDGWLFFEINQQYGQAVRSMLQSLDFKEMQLHADIHGNDRMVAAQRPLV